MEICSISFICRNGWWWFLAASHVYSTGFTAARYKGKNLKYFNTVFAIPIRVFFQAVPNVQLLEGLLHTEQKI